MPFGPDRWRGNAARFAALLAAVVLGSWAAPGHAASAGSLSIATAANFKSVMDDWIAAFKVRHPGARVEATYASSGKLSAQIRSGAPFDLFFAADREYPLLVVEADKAATPVRWYAQGRLVLWSASLDASTLDIKDLVQSRFTTIAIANPRTAPYGARAVEALLSSGIWPQVQARVVYGESIAQAAQFVQTGNAQIGVIALAQVLHPELARRGGYALVPENLHSPLVQGYVVTAHGRSNDLAWEFADFIATKTATLMLQRRGYALPDLSVAP